MQRDDAVYVGHMLDTARKAIEKIQRRNLRLALAYLIQIIGEAGSRGVPRVSRGASRGSLVGDHRDAPEFRQTNAEHQLVDWIHEAIDQGSGIRPWCVCLR